MTNGGSGTGSARADELLGLLYQQGTDRLAARFGADYDIAAGADRFGTWLREHAAADQAGLERRQAGRSVPLQARLAVSGLAASGLAAAAAGAGEAVIAAERVRAPGGGILREIPVARTDRDADRAVTALYDRHYSALVRLAAFLVRDIATAEEIVQDSFVAMHSAWRRLPDSDRALCWLRRSVLNRSRSVLRRRIAADRKTTGPAPDLPRGQQHAMAAPEFPAVLPALRALPAQQREVLVMRYYADLSDAQIAEIIGISEGAVSRRAARATAALRAVLDAGE